MRCELTLAATLLICITSVIDAGLYTNCGSNNLATIDKVGVTDCDGSHNVCTLKRDSNVTISIDFKTKSDIAKVNTIVHGVFQSMAVRHLILSPDACKSSGLSCPLKGSTEHHYFAIMPVLKAYPRVKVDVKWQLQNEKHASIICILIPSVIK